jgi:5-methylcytosine-specific restriction endonuclease McrA
MRSCALDSCGGSLEGKRSNALYCDRTCKTKASDARRIADGRSRQRDRARYPNEAEHRREYARQYLQDNPERMRAIRRQRRLRQKVDRRLFTQRDWRRMKARFDYRCAYCNKRSEDLHREHVIPLSRGGRHSVGNILPACPDCNFSKKTKLLSEWRYRERR